MREADLLALHERFPSRYPVLLESVSGAEPLGRHDVLFALPAERLIQSGDGTLAGDVVEAREGGRFLDALDRWLARERRARPATAHDAVFADGWFLYLGYELAAEIEPTLRLPSSVLPRAVAWRMHGALLRDRRSGDVRIVARDESALEQLRTQVASLAKGGASRLIVDIRNTAAGDLAEGITAARLFVGSGTIAIRESRTGGQAKIAAQKGDGSVALPVTLLVDSGTSGPAEIFAAALAGNKRAELMGERTVGRTGVQEIVKLPDGSALWITATRYLTPGGAQIQAKGLEPDVAVEQPEGEFGAPAPPDAVLQRAIERLSTKKAA